MKISTNISPERIADIMVGAIEGNHMTRSWCNGVFIDGAWGMRYQDADMGVPEWKDLPQPWYSNPAIYDGAFLMRIEEIVDEGKELTPDNIKVHIVTDADFVKAFELMAEKHGSHFGDFLNENDDNITQDVFLQLVALKEVVYG